MFLKRIKIEKVRSIRNLEIHFDSEKDIRKWTFILGENGAGKSTILRSIALLLAGGEGLGHLIGDTSAWVRNGFKQCKISGTIVTAAGEERELSMIIERGHSVREVYAANIQTLDLLDSALEHSLRSYITFGYGTSRRLGGMIKGKGRDMHPRARSVATLFSNEAELVAIEKWAIDLHYRRGKEGLQIIRSALRQMLPDAKFKGINKDNRTLEFTTADGLVPLNQLSDGYQSVIAWCGDLLYNVTEIFGDYKKPLDVRGLLLIDEIDLHLHPIWQRQLIDFLSDRFKNLQIIATTHSALTAHQAGEDELYFLKRGTKQQGAVLHKYEGAPDRLLVHQLLMSPIFGLNSNNSPQVEKERKDLSELKKKKKRTVKEKKKMLALTESLADTPDWARTAPTDRKIANLLGKIEAGMK